MLNLYLEPILYSLPVDVSRFDKHDPKLIAEDLSRLDKHDPKLPAEDASRLDKVKTHHVLTK